MLGFGQATTELNSVQDFLRCDYIPELEHSRIQWVVVRGGGGGIFRFSFLRFVF